MPRQRRHVSLLCFLVALAAWVGPSRSSHADEKPAFVVIVNAKNASTSLEKRFVSDVFLGKRTQWSKGKTIKPVDQNAKSGVRAKFTTAIHGRTVAAVRRFWAQQVFSGTGAPPPHAGTDADVVSFVEAHEGAIGYVASGTALGAAKIVQVK